MAASENVRRAEIVVIGAGPGGYAAAFLAADKGKKVALVEDSSALGGVCLNRGCIPSKALLHLAKLINETREAREMGLSFADPKIDVATIRKWKGQVVDQLAGGVAGLCKSRGVQLVRGKAVFESSARLRIDGGDQGAVEFDHAIVATGSRPAVPPAFNIQDPRVMNSTGALQLDEIPGRLLVVGGGYIGLEMGTVYAALGSKVTVVELLDGILMGADRDLVRPLQKRLEGKFEAILLKTKVVSLETKKKGIDVGLEGPDGQKTLTFDRVLVSVGRKPNTEGLGLEKTGVKVNAKGFIEVDRKQRTADPRIWAIGDVAGEPMLAHKASREGRVAVEALLGEPAEFDNIAIPAVVFTDPEVAWCGLTENEASAQGRKVEVARFPWGASGRALTLGRTEGLTKVIYDPGTERVLGVGIVGVGAGELIAEGTLAVEMAAVAGDLGGTIHAHPTLSETLMESAELLHGTATHLFRKKKG
ncbi:MAG TPA: dihydrolipoyl dehydrogenase [Verrucomicrobiae bacterium]|nr:dihydrolipoyl dehydrogenase [Verrucomicrobiae bacterium]